MVLDFALAGAVLTGCGEGISESVHLGANLHVTAEKSAKGTIYNNQRINELNLEIQKIGDGLGCYYINVNEIFDDQQGNLLKEYSTDGSHILGKYYADWVQWILSKEP